MSLFKVFPAQLTKEGQKVPLISGWREKATNDPEQIRLWRELFRERLAFFGAPTGAANGFFVLDVDVKTNGFETIQKLGLQIPNTVTQRTLNGGIHYLFKYDANRDTGNRVGFLQGLDIRSTGGWVGCYQFDFSHPLADAPDWLYDLVNRPKNIEPAASEASIVRVSPEIAQAIITSSLEEIRNAPAGESNDTLNREGFKIGQLVASGSVTRQFAFDELFRAAKERGKPDYEAKATIESALSGGAKHPLTSAFGNEAPKLAFEVPAPPGVAERWTPHYLTRGDLLNTSKLRKPQLFRDWSTEDISITTADGGTGKTTLKLFEAICLALGERFLGFENLQRGRTLFITGEDTAAKLAAMLGAIMNQMGLFQPGAENEAKVETVLQSIVIKKDADLCMIAKDRQGFLTPNSTALEKVLQAVDDIRPKMIVFDPISSFWGSESALNDMNKAVTRFVSELVDRSHACVEMVNHMGKSSSANKDMSQFAGRGGSGLPSNSRVSRVLRSLTPEEHTDLTDGQLLGDQTSMLCNVNKFSDGSPLFNKPFVIVRNGYLFNRVVVTPKKAKEMESKQDDQERVFTFIKEQRNLKKYPTKNIVIGWFRNQGVPISESRVKSALGLLSFDGHMGEKIVEVVHPDATVRERALVIADMDGKEI